VAFEERFMNLNAAITTLESQLDDPGAGLPTEVFLFVSRITPLVNVDLLIQDNRGSTLLTWRNDEFFGVGWHVPGGMIRYKETAADRIRACAREELGADVSFDATPVLVSETIREESSRGHFISLLYRCRLLSPLEETRKAGFGTPSSGEWRWHDGCPSNLLDVQRHYAAFF
jgi:ADP-ribose pyrophosphatase YjhB (NUDIX family)